MTATDPRTRIRTGDALVVLAFNRQLFHLALMDLFGLVEVEHPQTPVVPWAPVGVAPTPFGEALFAGFGDPLEVLDLEEDLVQEGSPSSSFGRLQPLLGQWFPAWQNNLALPEPEAREGTFVFRVSLGKTWRLIAVPADFTLDDLVAAILDAVDFDFDHLYEFTFRDRFGGKVSATHPQCDDGELPADEVEIGELPLQPGETMKFVYDFGDNWQFTVKLERIDPPNKRMKRAKVLESHGKAPQQYPEWE
jgi:hypothetical protein